LAVGGPFFVAFLPWGHAAKEAGGEREEKGMRRKVEEDED
jgi:hypothetical protein